MKVHNEKGLADAIQANQDTIIIEGDLSRKTVIIKGTGKVAWLLALGSISVAVIVVLKSPIATAGGPPAVATMGFVAMSSAGTAVSILGLSTTIAAISICVAAKSNIVLKKLYNNYKIVSKDSNSVVIKRIK